MTMRKLRSKLIFLCVLVALSAPVDAQRRPPKRLINASKTQDTSAFNSVTLGAQKHLIPLSLDDAMATRNLVWNDPIDLSPDGELLAYTVSTYNVAEPLLQTKFSNTGV